MTLKLNLGGITLTANRETLKLGATIYYKRHEGQLLYGKQNFFHGSMALIPKEAEGYATSGDVPALNISRINKNYLIDYIGRPDYYKPKEALSTGTGSKRIHEKTLLSFDIQVPSLEEQTKINQLFQSLDHTITLHEEKRKQLEQLKKALLQKIFADKTGYPDIRFKGFEEPWDNRKLGDESDIFDGIHQTPKYKDSGIMFLSVENIKTLTSKKYISKEDFDKDFKIFPEKGDILMTRIGDVGTPNVVNTKEKVAFYVSLALLKHVKTDPYFLCNAINSPYFQANLRKRTLLTAIPQKINKDEIGKVSLMVAPSDEEQKKIGRLFQCLDSKLSLIEKKIKQLKQLKQALLQQMFI